MLEKKKAKYIYSLKFKSIFTELVEDMDCKVSERAKNIGLNYATYTSIIDFGKIPKPQILIRISNFFKVSIENLLGRSTKINYDDISERSNFNERLKILKNKHSMSDYRLARKLHIETNYITNWRQKNYIPSFDYLVIMTDIFKVTLDYLLGISDDDSKFEPSDNWE